jgi:hypothetical protein
MGGALVDDFIYGQQNSRGFRAQDDIIYLRRKGQATRQRSDSVADQPWSPERC